MHMLNRLLSRFRGRSGSRRSLRQDAFGNGAFAFAGSVTGLSGAPALSSRATSLPAVDRPLIGVVLSLLLIGTVMVYSASISLADSPRYNVAPTHFLVRHLASLGIAFCAAVIAFQIPVAAWQRLAPLIFVGAFVLLI